MKETIARPYAEAVYAQAVAEGSQQSWSDLLQTVAAAVADPAMQAVLDNPKYSAEQLEALVLSVAEGASATQQNLVKLLVQNKRLQVVDAIAEQFETLAAAHDNRAKVEVSSAYALSEAEVTDLRESLEKKFARSVEVEVTVDESLLGGLVIRSGDMVIDNSIRTQMAQFGNSLTV